MARDQPEPSRGQGLLHSQTCSEELVVADKGHVEHDIAERDALPIAVLDAVFQHTLNEGADGLVLLAELHDLTLLTLK